MTSATATPPPPPPIQTSTARHRGGGIALVVLGSIVALIAIGLLAGGGFLMWADRTQRDSSGYLTSPSTRLASSSYAIASTNLDVAVSAPDWHLAQRALGSVRVTADAGASGSPIFLGIAPRSDVLRYLGGVDYDEVTSYAAAHGGPTYRPHTGAAMPIAPTSESFWVAQTSGTGRQSLTWNVANGVWAVVLMNVDGSRGIAADVTVGAQAPFLFPLAIGLLIGGAVVLVIAGLLLVHRSLPAGDL